MRWAPQRRHIRLGWRHVRLGSAPRPLGVGGTLPTISAISPKGDVAQGRAASWRGLGDVAKAISYEEEAVKLDPDATDAWSHLAKLYQQGGRSADAQQAEARAKGLGTQESH